VTPRGVEVSPAWCTVADCFRPAPAGGLCWAHRVQARRRLPHFAGGGPRDRWDALVDAVISFADAPDDNAEEFQRREIRLRRAARVWAAGRDGS
jgi:hypothetical protein